MPPLIKRRVGGQVDALSGLTMETLWLAPIAIAQLVFVGMTSGLTIGNVSVLQTVSMTLAGIVTAVPLLLFAAAARRVPLTIIGLTQTTATFNLPITGYFLNGLTTITATATDSAGNTSEFSQCIFYVDDTLFEDGFGA